MKTRLSIVFVLAVSLALSLTGGVAVQSQGQNVELVAQIGVKIRDVVLQGDYAYVADYAAGLRIINVSDPAAPAEVGFYDTPGAPWDVAVAGDYAYVADDWEGLRVIDVSDPAAPTEVGFYDTPGYASGVVAAGDYAYVADYAAGLRIVDVSDPAAPSEEGFYDTPGNAMGVAVAGDYAYVSDVGRGLRIVDVSDPAAPTEVGFYVTPGRAWSVAVAGDYAYVADDDGLRIINVSDPAAPTEEGFYDTPGYASGVVAAGDYAYVADRYKGLRIVDVSDPAAPIEVGFCDTPGLAEGVAVAGDYAYVAADVNGLRIINVSDPTAPTEEGFYVTPEEAEGVEERPEDSSSCQIKFASQYAFEDFPTTVYTRQPAPVDFTSNPEKKLFITKITEGAQKGPNFAGHYTFIFWGCGTECQNSVVVDTFNGKIYEGLAAERGFDFKINSNLLIVNPPGESGYYDQHCGCTYCAPRVYLWQDGAFKKLEPKVSYAEAIRMIRDLPETQGYLESVEDGRVDARLDASGKRWVVRVYQIVKETEGVVGHTATANRYYVDKETGQITKEFSY